jgi:hypothetical protein
MDNSYEYNFNSNKSGPIPEKIKPDGNEYLLPLNNDIYDILFNALNYMKKKKMIKK